MSYLRYCKIFFLFRRSPLALQLIKLPILEVELTRNDLVIKLMKQLSCNFFSGSDKILLDLSQPNIALSNTMQGQEIHKVLLLHLLDGLRVIRKLHNKKCHLYGIKIYDQSMSNAE